MFIAALVFSSMFLGFGITIVLLEYLWSGWNSATHKLLWFPIIGIISLVTTLCIHSHLTVTFGVSVT